MDGRTKVAVDRKNMLETLASRRIRLLPSVEDSSSALSHDLDPTQGKCRANRRRPNLQPIARPATWSKRLADGRAIPAGTAAAIPTVDPWRSNASRSKGIKGVGSTGPVRSNLMRTYNQLVVQDRASAHSNAEEWRPTAVGKSRQGLGRVGREDQRGAILLAPRVHLRADCRDHGHFGSDPPQVGVRDHKDHSGREGDPGAFAECSTGSTT